MPAWADEEEGCPVWVPEGIKNEWEPSAMDDSHSAVIVHNRDKLFDADFYRRAAEQYSDI
jgi:hypothetical protein